MEPWLIGKILSPFAALLLLWLVAKPLSQIVDKHVPASTFKRFLFAEMDERPVKYGLLIVSLFFIAIIIAFAVSAR